MGPQGCQSPSPCLACIPVEPLVHAAPSVVQKQKLSSITVLKYRHVHTCFSMITSNAQLSASMHVSHCTDNLLPWFIKNLFRFDFLKPHVTHSGASGDCIHRFTDPGAHQREQGRGRPMGTWRVWVCPPGLPLFPEKASVDHPPGHNVRGLSSRVSPSPGIRIKMEEKQIYIRTILQTESSLN